MPANRLSYAATNVDFDLSWGYVPPLAQTLEVYERPGLDGVAARTVGQRSEPVEIRTLKFLDDIADATAHLNSCYAARGELCTFYDAYSVQSGNVLCLDVRPVPSDGYSADPRKAVWQNSAGRIAVRVAFMLQRAV